MKIGKIYNNTAEDLTAMGNQLKEVFLDRMVNEGIINKEKQDELNQYCFVISSRKSFFGKIWQKVFGEGNEGLDIIVVKMLI